MPRPSAEIVKSRAGRQYHIGVAPGEAAPTILLCGDPARAERTAARFDRVRVRRANREYVTLTGTFEGVPISVMGTGIGPDNMEIAVIELSQVVRRPTFIRIGSCGALQPGIRIGDLVISSGAVRLENTTTWFVEEGYPAVSHHEPLLALIEATAGKRVHVGLTASAPGFYGAQGRRVPGFPPRRPDLPRDLARQNVANFEMEISSLFTLASLAGHRAGAVCAVFADRGRNRFISPAVKRKAEGDVIEAGLRAVRVLARLDAEKRRRGLKLWYPDR